MRRAVAVTVVALTIGLVCHLLLAATAVAGGNTAVASLAVGGYATAAASGLYAAWRALCHTRLAASG